MTHRDSQPPWVCCLQCLGSPLFLPFPPHSYLLINLQWLLIISSLKARLVGLVFKALLHLILITVQLDSQCSFFLSGSEPGVPERVFGNECKHWVDTRVEVATGIGWQGPGVTVALWGRRKSHSLIAVPSQCQHNSCWGMLLGTGQSRSLPTHQFHYVHFLLPSHPSWELPTPTSQCSTSCEDLLAGCPSETTNSLKLQATVDMRG